MNCVKHVFLIFGLCLGRNAGAPGKAAFQAAIVGYAKYSRIESPARVSLITLVHQHTVLVAKIRLQLVLKVKKLSTCGHALKQHL